MSQAGALLPIGAWLTIRTFRTLRQLQPANPHAAWANASLSMALYIAEQPKPRAALIAIRTSTMATTPSPFRSLLAVHCAEGLLNNELHISRIDVAVLSEVARVLCRLEALDHRCRHAQLWLPA